MLTGMRRTAALLAIAVWAAPSFGAELPKEARLFDYRASVVNVQGPPPVTKDGLSLVPLDFDSPKGGDGARATAFLVIPHGGRSPAVIIAPDLTVSRDDPDVRDEAFAFARAGIAALIVEAPPARPKPHTRAWGARRDRVVLIQAVTDLRRAVDFLQSRIDIETKRIAFVGHGFGARAGANLCAVDKRVRACALAGLHPRPGRAWAYSTLTPYKEMRGDATPERRRVYARAFQPLEPQLYVGQIRRLYLQFAKGDPLIPESLANVTIARAGRRAKVSWYPGAADLPTLAQARNDRLAWVAAILRPN